MPNTRSAKKALRQAARKRARNLQRTRVLRETVKQIKKTAAQNKETAIALLPKAYKAIDKAAKRGIIKKNTASRKKSQLAKFVYKK